MVLRHVLVLTQPDCTLSPHPRTQSRLPRGVSTVEYLWRTPSRTSGVTPLHR